MKLALALALASVFAEPRRAQENCRADARVELTTRVVFAGTVVTAAGSPAADAVVVSSAGGEVVTRADGRFELSADVPLTAQWVEVTALVSGGKLRGSMSASARILPAALSPTTSVGSLVVAPSTGEPRWRSAFGSLPGVDGDVRALAVFDDGNGPALYVAGTLTSAGGRAVNCIARWDGRAWSTLGGGLVGVSVQALAVFDDGSGPALYAGGFFASAGGVSASNIARWDGTTWSALGSGLNGGVNALSAFDDGSGPALYVTGAFSGGIARWNGASWSALGGLGGVGRALAVFDDGSGPALYAGGSFTSVNGAAANRIARWDGVSWSTLGAGVSGSGHGINVQALAVLDDGNGPALYAGGHFQIAGAVAASSIARWDGASWSALGSGTSGDVFVLAEFDDGSGPALYAGGAFPSAGGVTVGHVARWDGTSWSALDTGLGGPTTSTAAQALAAYDAGGGPALYAGGVFSQAGSVPADNVARLRTGQWSALEQGRIGLSGPVEALVVGDDGSGESLYAAGQITGAGGVLAHGVARWNGTRWSALGQGMTPGPSTPVPSVLALGFFDSGSGPELYAGGLFERSNATVIDGIARWNGASWVSVGSGFHGWVHAFCVFDDGDGPMLYTGGNGVPASRWNGTTWTDISFGLNNDVNAFAIFDDGSRPALYAAGAFISANGEPRNYIGRWNGSGWSEVSGGTTHRINALAVFDDGRGPALYAAGDYPLGGAVPVSRWDGASWTQVGTMSGNTTFVRSLLPFDDGGGPALYACGRFLQAGGVAARDIAKWDGTSWSPLGAGLGSVAYALVRYDDGRGAALVAGGFFGAGPAKDSFLAKWGLAPRVRASH